MNRKMKTIDIAYIALSAVIIAVCSWISIPMAVPFTMQTFAIFCTLGLLGGKRGTISILVYLLLGAVGIPVFSGFTGGFGVLLGPTGGYIAGFLLMGLLYWLFEIIPAPQPASKGSCGSASSSGSKKRLNPGMIIRIISMVLGLLILYAFGTIWFVIVYSRNSGPMSFGAALASCVLPFIIPDLIKMALAVFISERVRKYLK